jgi:hypothetical protein
MQCQLSFVLFLAMEHRWKWKWQGKTEVLGEKPVPVPLSPPQIPHGLTRDRTRVSAVGGRRLTAWAMATDFCTNLNTVLATHTDAQHAGQTGFPCQRRSRPTIVDTIRFTNTPHREHFHFMINISRLMQLEEIIAVNLTITEHINTLWEKCMASKC